MTRLPSHSHDHAHSHEHAHSHAHAHAHDHEHDHEHAHDHTHSHSHDHSHSYDHDLVPPVPSPNPPLPAGAGVGKLLFLDTPTGISGDMTVAALLDLGVPPEVFARSIARLALDGCRLEHLPARSGVLGGTRFVVHVQGPQPERDYAAIDRLLAAAGLDSEVEALARRIFRHLAEAEAEVHRMPVDRVTFHEVGAVDSIADIVAAAAGFAYLGARIAVSPLPIGRGTVSCQHGVLPLPAPATLLCLRGVPTYDPGLEVELVTPTGAAIVATVASEFVRWPSFSPERVGYGVGTRVLADRPNGLRAVLGSPASSSVSRDPTHVVLEANVDDMTGELAGHAIDVLLRAGALDCWAAAVTMKKGRPGLVLSALCELARADELSAVLLRETSSIGVRRLAADRVERPRRRVRVTTAYGDVSLKVSEGAYGPPQVKPEFDECAGLARAANVPVREVLAAALAAYDAGRVSGSA